MRWNTSSSSISIYFLELIRFPSATDTKSENKGRFLPQFHHSPLVVECDSYSFPRAASWRRTKINKRTPRMRLHSARGKAGKSDAWFRKWESEKSCWLAGGGHESTFTFSSYFYYVINNASSEPEGRTEIKGKVIYSRAICRLYSRFYLVACNC